MHTLCTMDVVTTWFVNNNIVFEHDIYASHNTCCPFELRTDPSKMIEEVEDLYLKIQSYS